jgi:GntR family phosphonate transport system transcriptional regulator
MTEQGPIWRAIAEALRGEIDAGQRRPGDRLPTEAALSRRFGVNRHTVRRALARLAEEGLVYSRRGAGAFVAARPTEYPIGSRVRFHANLRAAGRLPERRLTALETRAASAEEAEALALAPGAPVTVAEGVSLADGCPVAHFVSAFPADRLPGIEAALGALASVTEALARVGVADYTRAATRLTACLADSALAARLEIAPGAPLILSESVNAGPDGQPVEYGRTRFVGERVTLILDHG